MSVVILNQANFDTQNQTKLDLIKHSDQTLMNINKPNQTKPALAKSGRVLLVLLGECSYARILIRIKA